MQPLDIKVIDNAIEWLQSQQSIWLCTVISTFGSSPRAPGSLLVANSDGAFTGSLSGGCVEEDFIARIKSGEFNLPFQVLSYGGADNIRGGVTLPCDGVLEVLVEQLAPGLESLEYLQDIRSALQGVAPKIRRVDLNRRQACFLPDTGTGARVEYQRQQQQLDIRISPVARLIICGLSPVATACAEFAGALGFEVIVCDPRPEVAHDFDGDNIEFQPVLPSLFISQPGRCHQATAVVALTHDPRIDDLAMIEAVTTPAFYIGVMGSKKTSANRAERLKRSGGLSQAQIDKIHMPIGLALGSKTPAEIALAVMADVVRVLRGRPRDGL